MATNIRLSTALQSRARSYCDDVGISLNSLVSVALDQYLRTPEQPTEPAAQRESVASIPQPENISESPPVVVENLRKQFQARVIAEDKPKHPGPKATAFQRKDYQTRLTLWQAVNHA